MKKIIPNDAVLVPDTAELKFQGEIFGVYQWLQEMYDGTSQTFEMLKRADTVTAICIIDDQILVIDDEQPHLGTRTSFPGGRVDDTDESIEAAGKREVLEETGYSFKNWRLIKVTQPYRKMEWFVHVLLAWDVESIQEPKFDPGEKITLKKVPFGDLKQRVLEDKDYLGESRDIFGELSSAQELLGFSEFIGKTVNR
jgi:ADP-ribose pyrophosphatase